MPVDREWYLVRIETASKRYLTVNSKHELHPSYMSAMKFIDRITKKNPDVRCRLFKEVSLDEFAKKS